MHIHILGICGTFMAGVAVLARELGHEVSGSDNAFYPPMSEVLARAGIACHGGYDVKNLSPAPDLVVIGNALSRGNPCVEYVLDRGLHYTSGPAWLTEHCLRHRWVIAIAGTHGKTTTASMTAWILEHAGLAPGFLIGGLPANFGVTARAGEAPFFVIEADEYDSAFFDKRSKFVHYGAHTLVINNLEYDHADIFPDLQAIQTQFHHVVRTVPSTGAVIHSGVEPYVDEVLARGVWSDVITLEGPKAEFSMRMLNPQGSEFEVLDRAGISLGKVTWPLIGQHNVSNALAALAAAHHAGVTIEEGCRALSRFAGVSRRLELRAEIDGVRIYDDFAHHPSAIRTVLDGLRKAYGTQRLIAVLEPRSNTMRMGVHNETLASSLSEADAVWAYQPPDSEWSLIGRLGPRATVRDTTDAIINDLVRFTQAGDHVVIMSNGGFEGIHERLLARLAAATGTPT